MATNRTDLPEHLQDLLVELENIKKEVYSLALGLLLEGELKPPPNTPLGESYPYDYNLYMKDSLDPNVQAISSLLEKVEKTITSIEKNVNHS